MGNDILYRKIGIINDDKKRVTIIGAGPAGLTAAYTLIKHGIAPLVLEKTRQAGGIARTEKYKDFYFDIGGHRFFTKIDAINRLWHEMMGNDTLWQADDHDLIQLAAREIAALGLASASEITDSHVIRQPCAYPVYDNNYKSCLETIKNYLKRFKNLQTIGRSGMHRYNNMDHSMLTGILAVKNYLGDAHDIWAVNGDETYLEENTGVSDH